MVIKISGYLISIYCGNYELHGYTFNSKQNLLDYISKIER